MKRAPGVVRVGTAAELADNGAGYSCNGESQWSRDAASAPVSPELRSKLGKLIRGNVKDMRKLSEPIRNETDPARLEKLRQNQAIKGNFLNKLRAELVQ